MTDRLRELATEAARSAHVDAIGCRPRGGGHVDDMEVDTAEELGFATCPHPDCVLVREAAASAVATEPERTLSLPTLKYTVADKGRCIVCGTDFRAGEQVYRDIEPDTWRCLTHGPWLAATSAWATEPPTDDERVPSTPRQVMAYRPVVTPVRAAPRPAVCTCRHDSGMSTDCDVHYYQPLSPPAHPPRVEARRDQTDGPQEWPPVYVETDQHIEQAAGDLYDDIQKEFLDADLSDDAFDRLHANITLRIRQAITHRKLYPPAT